MVDSVDCCGCDNIGTNFGTSLDGIADSLGSHGSQKDLKVSLESSYNKEVDSDFSLWK